MARLAPGGRRLEVTALLHPDLGRGKCLGLDDPQVRHRCGLPFQFRVHARHPLAGPGILAQRDLVPDQAAVIERVGEQPRPAGTVAMNGAGAPEIPPRWPQLVASASQACGSTSLSLRVWT